MKKLVMVINGAGGVGKDTLCEFAMKHFKVMNISSITPIKELAALAGWDGKKDDKSRKFLSDLKQLSVEYNDYPTLWCTERYRDDVPFFHIIRCARHLIVHRNLSCIAGFIGNGTTFDDARDFQIFIQAQIGYLLG